MAFNFEDSTNLFANMDLTAGTTTDPTAPISYSLKVYSPTLVLR
ncbi:WSSV301 [White spot syndrome virus]|uniref:WSSV301 n=1 Tax=White spot syndrome virus TaxID=342409 RepID=A0A2I6SC41_9VIRU|nr:WSSV301 [White spot syndrome virus]